MIFYSTDFLKDDEITLKLEKTADADSEKGWLPAYYFAICDKTGKQMGTCDLRIGHNHNTFYGGNIGYEIREPFRGHHYAGKACLLLLELAKKHRMTEVLITCSPDNHASRKTCEYAGADLLEIAELPPDHPMRLEYGAVEKCRYRILLHTQ